MGKINMAIWLTCIFSGMVACEKEITVAAPDHRPKLVVHAYVAAGEYFTIAVGRSFRADTLLPPDAIVVKDALVILSVNGVVKDTLLYNNATERYISTDVRARETEVYKVVITAPGFDAVEAITSTPSLVPAVQLQYVRYTRTDIDGNLMNDVIVRFNDPGTEKNYYLSRLFAATHTYPFCVYTYDPAIERYQVSLNPFENDNCIPSDEVLYTDQSFNGRQKELVLSAQTIDLPATVNYQTGDSLRPYITRYMLTEDHYRYIKAGIALSNVDSDPFMQPVAIKGNVKNGYGLFTVYAAVTDTLR